jgi:hypothetical protein
MNAIAMTKDELHERRIESARIRMVHAETDEAKRKAMSEFYQLCDERSPKQKARMEAARELCSSKLRGVNA